MQNLRKMRYVEYPKNRASVADAQLESGSP
jgi:hypothetical protein